MMYRTIGRLRQLSIKFRNRLALFSALTFTLVVASSWSFLGTSTTAFTNTDVAVDNSRGAFSTFFDGISDQFAQVTATQPERLPANSSDDVVDISRNDTPKNSLQVVVDEIATGPANLAIPSSTEQQPSGVQNREVQIEAVPSQPATNTATNTTQ